MVAELGLPGDMEAYWKGILGKEVAQSSFALSKGEKLQWIQSINLKRKASETELLLELWYKDNFAGNDLKGRAFVDLLKTNLFLENKTTQWVEIKSEEQKVVGKLLVSLEWKAISIKNKEK